MTLPSMRVLHIYPSLLIIVTFLAVVPGVVLPVMNMHRMNGRFLHPSGFVIILRILFGVILEFMVQAFLVLRNFAYSGGDLERCQGNCSGGALMEAGRSIIIGLLICFH